MKAISAILFACLVVSAYASHYDNGQWRGHGAYPGDHRAGLVVDYVVDHDRRWDGGWDDGRWDDGHYNGGHYSNVVHGNGAVSVGAAGGVRNDVGHGIAIVGPPTATVKIVGPGRTGSIVAHGLWGPTHAHGHGHW